MRQVTSSTLPSKYSPLWTTLSVLSWMVLWLLIFELLLYIAVPPAPATVKPNKIQSFLEYGRSIEGKMHKMIAPTDEFTAPIALAGWLKPSQWHTKPSRPQKAEDLLIAIYGMSFAVHLSKVLAKLDSQITIRLIAAPGVPPNHTYTAYLLDKQQHSAQVVAMSILASDVVSMTTLTNMNKYFEYPMPFTYPKYSRIENRLKALWPKVRNLTDLRRFLNDKTLWEDYILQLRSQDSYYDPFLFNHNITDYVVSIRFVRRTYATRHARFVLETLHGPQGFFEHSEEIQVLPYGSVISKVVF